MTRRSLTPGVPPRPRGPSASAAWCPAGPSTPAERNAAGEVPRGSRQEAAPLPGAGWRARCRACLQAADRDLHSATMLSPRTQSDWLAGGRAHWSACKPRGGALRLARGFCSWRVVAGHAQPAGGMNEKEWSLSNHDAILGLFLNLVVWLMVQYFKGSDHIMVLLCSEGGTRRSR